MPTTRSQARIARLQAEAKLEANTQALDFDAKPCRHPMSNNSKKSYKKKLERSEKANLSCDDLDKSLMPPPPSTPQAKPRTEPTLQSESDYDITQLEDYDGDYFGHRDHKVVPDWARECGGDQLDFLLYRYSETFMNDEIMFPTAEYVPLFPKYASKLKAKRRVLDSMPGTSKKSVITLS